MSFPGKDPDKILSKENPSKIAIAVRYRTINPIKICIATFLPVARLLQKDFH